MKNFKSALIFGGGVFLACVMFILHSCSTGETRPKKPVIKHLNVEPPIRMGYVPLGKTVAAEFSRAVSFFQGQPIKVLYRLSSRGVLDISTKGNEFPKANMKYYRRSIGPVFLDGTDETIPKILLLGKPSDPDTVRDATAAEIAGFETFKEEERKDEHLDAAVLRFDTSDSHRMWWTGHYKFMMQWQADGFPTLTLQQFIDGHQNELDKND